MSNFRTYIRDKEQQALAHIRADLAEIKKAEKAKVWDALLRTRPIRKKTKPTFVDIETIEAIRGTMHDSFGNAFVTRAAQEMANEIDKQVLESIFKIDRVK